MMIETVKSKVRENVGKTCTFRFHGGRNQIDEFKGKITYLYPAVFTVLTEDDVVKTFSYSDVLIQSLEIVA